MRRLSRRGGHLNGKCNRNYGLPCRHRERRGVTGCPANNTVSWGLWRSAVGVRAVVTQPLHHLMSIHTRSLTLCCQSPTTEGVTVCALPSSDATEPRELCFYDTFDSTDEDVHYLLLHEAHVKHGVLLNVPPQLAPDGTAPAVPDVIMPIAQLERMRGMKLAYEPTHLPPPLHTTGTRQLIVDESFYSRPTIEKEMAAISSSYSVGSGTGQTETGSATSATAQPGRLPPDPTMKFHCSACGKAFRLKFSAEHHVKLKHGSDPKAAVVDGPGEGELTGKVTTTIKATKTAGPSPPIITGAADAKQQSNQQRESPVTGINAVKPPYNKAVLSLPSDELIDELLIEVWDAVAAQRDDVPKANSSNNFMPFASAVVGVADRRSETEVSGRPTARATPEGAAPGIKRPGAMVGGALAAAKGRGGGQILPIRQLIKKYPNPFGDSPNISLKELENEPVNPFVPEEELVLQLQIARERDGVLTSPPCSATAAAMCTVKGEKESVDVLKEKIRATRPSLATSAVQRRFTCPICAERQQNEVSGAGVCVEVPSFRLLDALLDHVELVHDTELGEEQLRELYATQRRSTLYPSTSAIGGRVTDSGALSSLGRKESCSGSSNDAIDKLNSLPEEVRRVIPPAPVEQSALSVHIRAGSNTVLLGRVADVQHGFLGALIVTQYVLEVDGDEEVNTSGKSAEEARSVEAEKEFIVVRCMGDNFPTSLLKEQVKLGSRVLVQGTLRMNRHVDEVSKRMHAYPFVQVVPPLGCVKVLG